MSTKIFARLSLAIMTVTLGATVLATPMSAYAATTPVTKQVSGIIKGIPNHPALAKSGKLLSIQKVTIRNGRVVSTQAITPLWGWWAYYYLTNVHNYGESSYRNLGSEEGSNPYSNTLTLTIDTSVSNTYSSNTSVSAGVISEGINASISAGTSSSFTTTFGISRSDTVGIPYGTTVEVDAYAGFDDIYFDVWYNPLIGNSYYAGDGVAHIYDNNVLFLTWKIS